MVCIFHSEFCSLLDPGNTVLLFSEHIIALWVHSEVGGWSQMLKDDLWRRGMRVAQLRKH